MAKAPKENDAELAAEAEGEEDAQPKGSKKLLIAAVVLSLVSLGGGFFLARMAFQEDAETYAPDYVEEVVEEGVDEELAAKESDEKNADGGGEGEEEIKTAEDGIIEFDEILTNITSFNQHGVPINAFLKMNVVMVYRPDPGSKELMESRKPFMRDLFNGYARSLTEADVRGMAGILTVKSELLKRARAAAGNDLPQEILISDLIVQ
ncbi:MAG: flagellar basal body-associated FliL family protein [Cognatishimia activa]|uniref:Flagellar protein FliL n=1 Tax=Cognatishimia activa TaxID=1715691 RepID=A0A975I8N0_9RHOB|nr:flagellar basal body-associated FliL family protein [Cognatishimia activa]QTN37194.1 flagellar basal body-associated FliL family protein [Cognatishimia activa]